MKGDGKMNRNMTFSEFKEMFSDYLGLEPEKLTEETNILTDIGVDSLSLVNTMLRLEKEFQVEFQPEDKIMTRKLGDAYELVMKHLK